MDNYIIKNTQKDFVARVGAPWRFWSKKKYTIEVGKYYYELSDKERAAVIAHEEGHIYHGHMKIKLRWFISLMWLRDTSWCMKQLAEQEHEADRYAVLKGHSYGLESFLRRCLCAVDGFHPSVEQRVARIRYHMKGVI